MLPYRPVLYTVGVEINVFTAGIQMKHILLTTDLSEEATAAFPLALELAAKFDARIELLTIIEDLAHASVLYAMDFPIEPGKEIQDQYKEKVENDLNAIAKNRFSEVNVSCTVKVAEESAHVTIRNYASEVGTDLIVMSTHGQTGLSAVEQARAGLARLLIGSVAERVVRESNCPVLTVPYIGSEAFKNEEAK